MLKSRYSSNSNTDEALSRSCDFHGEVHINVSDTRHLQEGDDGDVMFLIESGAFDCIKPLGFPSNAGGTACTMQLDENILQAKED